MAHEFFYFNMCNLTFRLQNKHFFQKKLQSKATIAHPITAGGKTSRIGRVKMQMVDDDESG